MKRQQAWRGRLVLGCVTALLTAVTANSASAFVAPTEKRYLTAPLMLEDQGAFYVGGVPKITNYANSATSEGAPNQLIIGAMYVQFQIPLIKRPRSWPLIMVHGGGYSGSCLESTPIGGEGWLPYFVRKGYSTYVVDQAGRGRSGFDRSVIHEARVTGNLNLIPTIGTTAANGIWTGWLGHLIPAGSTILDGTLIRHGDPGDPQGPEVHGPYPPAYPIPPVPNSVDPNIEARIGAIGPAPNPVNNTYLALEGYKWGLPNTDSTLPTSTCATCTPTTLNASDTWSPRALAELVERLGGAVIATHSQSGIIGHHTVRLLKERGKLDAMKGLITIEGVSCSLPQAGLQVADFANIPYMFFKGDYEFGVNSGCIENVAAIKAIGGTADYIRLDDPKYGGRFNGVTHMMMLDTKNLEVAEEIFKWAAKNIPNNAPR